MEPALQAAGETAQQSVGDQSHRWGSAQFSMINTEGRTGDIQIWRVDIISWRLPSLHTATVCSPDLPRPGLMSPRKEDQAEFPQDVGVGDLERGLDELSGEIARELYHQLLIPGIGNTQLTFFST